MTPSHHHFLNAQSNQTPKTNSTLLAVCTSFYSYFHFTSWACNNSVELCEQQCLGENIVPLFVGLNYHLQRCGTNGEDKVSPDPPE